MRRSKKLVRKLNKLIPAVASATATTAMLLAQSASAQTTYEWNTATSSNWDIASLWTPTSGAGTTFPGSGDTAVFNASGVNGTEIIYTAGVRSVSQMNFNNTGTTTIQGGTSAAPANQRITFSGGVTNGLTIPSFAGAVTIGVTGATMALQLDANATFTVDNGTYPTPGLTLSNTTTSGGTGARTLTFAGTGFATYTGTITGAAAAPISVVKNGSGIWRLSANTYTGGTTINAGQLLIQSNNALGVTTQTVTFNGGTLGAISTRTVPSFVGVITAGTTVTFCGSNSTGDLVFDGPTTFGTSGNIRVLTNNLRLNGNIDLGSATRTLRVDAGTTFNGVVTGAAGVGIIKTGTSNLHLASTAANTFTGDVVIMSGSVAYGSSSVGSPGGNANARIYTATGGTFTARFAGALTVPSIADYLGGLGTISMGNNGSCSLTVGDSTDFSFSGNIVGSNPMQTGGISKAGSGTWTLANTANTYSGTQTVLGGVLEFKTIADGAIPANIHCTTGSTTATVDDATGLQVGMAVNDYDVLTPGTTITNIAGTTLTLSQAALSDSGTLSVSGHIGFPNTLGLATSLPTRLVLAGGTLRHTGTASDTNRLFTVNATGGTIDASGTSNAALRFTGTGLVAFAGSGARTLTLKGASTGANTLTPILGDGTGGATSLVKDGAGIWTLAGANTYSGTTSILGGTLQVGTSANLGDGSATNGLLFDTGGTLKTTGAITTSRSLTVNSGGGTIDTNTQVDELGGTGNNTFVGNLTVTGGGSVTFNRTGGTVAVTPGSTLTIDPGATVNLDGSVDSLSDGVNHVNVVNNSTTSFNINNGNKNVGSLAGVGNTSVAAGASLTATHIRQNALTVNGTATVRANGGPAGASKIGTLTVNGANGKLDLQDNDLVVDTGGVANVRTLIHDGWGSTGSWAGATGVLTTGPATQNGRPVGLGYAQGDDTAIAGLGGSLSGQAFANNAATGIVKYTYFGDSDLDGDVALSDVGVWAPNYTGDTGSWASPGAKLWTQFDMDYDGDVSLADVGFWAPAYTGENNLVLGPTLSGGVSAVPEPASLGLVALGGLAMLRRRRRASH